MAGPNEEAYVLMVDCLDLDNDIPLTKKQQALVDGIATALTAARAEQRERLIRVLGPEEVSDLAHHAVGVWQAFEDSRLFSNTKENWQKAHDAAEDAKEIARLATGIRAGKE